MRYLAITVAFLVLFGTAAAAQAIPDYTDKYVNDFAHVFTPEQASELKQLFSGVDQQTTAELTVLTVETVSPMDTSQYAQEVFDKWKIGKADKDNGLLILYAKQENKIWVQTGYGLEGILPDSKIGRILDEQYVPRRDAGNVTDGVVEASKALAQVVIDNADEVRSGQAGPAPPSAFDMFFTLLPLILFLLFFIAMWKKMRMKCKYGHPAKFVRWEGSWAVYRCEFGHEVKSRWGPARGGLVVLGGGFRGGGGGFGGGGGGFGGGGSGGGGAGR
jgi:uncharacterized protein